MREWYNPWKEHRPSTRREMFDVVWKCKLVKLADIWKTSEYTILRVCKKYEIPCPNDFPKRIPTPKLQGKGNQEISFDPRELPGIVLPREDKAELDKMEFAKVKVPKIVKTFHPLIKEIEVDNRYGYTFKSRVLKINTATKGLEERANLIMDTIIKAIEKAGGKVGEDSSRYYKNNKKSAMGFLGRYHSICIWEPSERVKEKDKYTYPSTRLVPRGTLAIRIDSRWSSGFQQVYTESKSTTLESRVPEILTSLFLEGLILKRSQTANQYNHFKEDRARKEEAQKAQVEQDEKQFIQNFNTAFIAWEKTQKLNAFLMDMRNRVIQNPNKIISIENFNKWYRKAKKLINAKDPLISLFYKDKSVG